MGNAVSYFDDFGEGGDFLNSPNNNNNNNNNENPNNSDSDGNFSFLNRFNIFQGQNFNNNNRQSFINITEEELEVRRKQRESDKSKTKEMAKEELKRHNSAILIQKYWKGFSQRKKYSLFLTKIQVFKELLLTEKDYIQFLDIIIRVYANPLKQLALQAQKNKKESLVPNDENLQTPIHNLNLDETPLTLEECKILFSQIEVILLYNSQLFDKLKSRLLSNFISKYSSSSDQKNSLTTPSTTPNKNTITPNKNTITPNKNTVTPSTTPNKNTITPNKNIVTSNTPSTSPNKNTVTPSTTPNKNTITSTSSTTTTTTNPTSSSYRNTQTLINSIEANEKKIGFYQEVGDIFLEMIDFLKVPYSHYIINFPLALKVLENANKRPSFMLFTQQCKSLPEVGRRDLQSFVSMPIQRIPRYVLLLRELLKFTVPGHSDHTNIELAVKRMENIANLINKQMKEDETSKEVFQISQKLKPTIPNLVEPHRKIMKEGMVKIFKVDNSHDSDQSTGTIRPASILSIAKGGSKYIFLFNDLFVITKKKKLHYQVEKVLSLENSTIIDNYKMIKQVQQEKEIEKLKQKQNVGKDDSDSDSDTNTSVSSISSLSKLTSPTSPDTKKGERYYFKLHTLQTSIVICLPTESEKDSWKNEFITVINLLTENSLSFNPKWSKNDLIYGEQRKRSASTSSLKRGSIISNENFTLTKSIAELLAITEPIKGINNTYDSNNKNVNITNNTTTTTTTTTSNNEIQTNNPKDLNTDTTTTNRNRSASVGISGTFERLLQVIKS